MDFHTMKRKELQALCKKHKIPANLKNLEMANRLASLLKIDDEKPKEQRVKSCLKNLDDLCAIDEGVSEGKDAKKVRFSPQNQTFVFEKTNPRATRLAARRRKSMLIGEGEITIEEKVSAIEDDKENARVTRHTRQQNIDRGVNETVSATEDASIADQCQERRLVTRNARQQKRDRGVNVTVSATEDASIADQCEEKRSVTSNTRRWKRDGGVSETVSTTEDASIVDQCQEKKPVTCNTRERKRDRGVNETVSTTEVASLANQCQERRSTRISVKRVKVESGNLNDKKSGVEVQEKGVSLRNKRPRKQENSRCPGKSDEQKRCVGKRKLSSIKHVEDLQTDALEKSVDLLNISESENLVNSVCEVLDIQNMLCNDSSAVEDNQGTSQSMHQTISPTLLLDECKFRNAVEGSCETSSEIKELAEEKAMLTNESSSEKVVSTKQPQNSVFSSNEEGILLQLYSSDGETTKALDNEVGTDKEKEYKEAVFLNGDSSEDAEIVLLPSSGFKTSPQNAISTVLRSCTEDSKTELENSASKVDSCVQCVPSLTSTVIDNSVCEPVFQGIYQPQLETVIPRSMIVQCVPSLTSTVIDNSVCEPVFQGIYQPQHETIIPRSMIVECEPNNGEVSPIKNPELEDRCAVAISINEQLTWTRSIVDSATPKEGLIIPDFRNLEGQISSQDMADVKFYPNINEFQSRLHKSPDTPKTSTIVSNEPVDSQTQKWTDHFGTHNCKNVAYDQDAEEVIPKVTVGEKFESSEGIDTYISERSAYPAESEINHKQGLEDESDSQTIHEETIGIAAEKDSIVIINVPEGSDMMDDSVVQLNDNHEDAVLADQNLEKAVNIVGYIQKAEEATSTAMVDEIIDTFTSDCSDDTADCERSHKQGLEEANNLQLTSCEESYGIASLFQLECAEDDIGLIDNELKGRNLIEVSDVELDNKISPLNAEIVLPFRLSSGFKNSPHSSISVPKSCTVDSKTELENSASKVDSCIQSDPPFSSTSIDKFGISVPVCETVLQDINQPQHETVIPRSIIVESEPNNGEVSSIKSTTLENQFTATISSNEQSQLTQTSSIVDSATPKEKQDVPFILREKGIIPDLCNLEGQISRYDIADVKSYPSLKELQPRLHLPADTPDTSTMISNELVDSKTDKCIGHLGTHESGEFAGFDQDAEGVTPTESEMNHKQGLEEETNSQTIHEETNGMDVEKDSVVISSELDGRNMTDDVSDVQLNDKHEDAILADQNLEKAGNIVGYIQEAEEATPTATVDEKSEGIDTTISDGSDNTTDCERSQKQGLEEANNYDIASLFQLECAEDDNGLIDSELKRRNLIEVSDFELDNNRKDAVLAGPNTEVYDRKGETSKETHEVCERLGNVSHPMDWEAYGSSSQNKAAILLQGSEEKLIIRSSVDEENINGENGTCADNRATVEPIAPSPEALRPVKSSYSAKHSESEEDFIGLVVLERITEQQSRNVNSSLTPEPEESDGENFSLTPKAETVDGETFSLIPEPVGADVEKVPNSIAAENLEVHEEKAGNVVGYIKEAEEVTRTAMVDERSAGIDTFISDRSDDTNDRERSHKQGLEVANNSQLTSGAVEDANGLIDDELKERNLVEVPDVELDNNHKDEVLADQNMEINEEEGETRKATYEISERPGDVSQAMDFEEYGSNSQNKVAIVLQGSEDKLVLQVDEEKISDENGTCVDSRATVELIASSPEHTESEIDLIGLVVLEKIAEQTEQQSRNVYFSLTPEPEKSDGENFSLTSEAETADGVPEPVGADVEKVSNCIAAENLEIHEEKAVNIVGYIKEAEEVTPTAMVDESSAGIDTFISDRSDDTNDRERSHKQGLEVSNNSQLTSGAVEDANGLIDDELKERNLIEVPDVELDNHHKDEVLADQNMEINEEEGDTRKATYEISERPGDVSQAMDFEEYGSNSQNKVSIVLQGSEDKLILQVDEEKISDENGTCVDSRATVELIASSPEHTESEVDLIGLVVLERIAEQTEQQSRNVNFSLTPEPEKSDGENLSLTPEAETADGVPEPVGADVEKVSNCIAAENLEVHEEKAGNIVGYIKEAEEVTPTAMVDERSAGIDTFISDRSDDTNDRERSHKQGLEVANNSQLTSGDVEDANGLVDDDLKERNLIEVPDVELDNNHKDEVLADQNMGIYEEEGGTCKPTYEISERPGDVSHPMDFEEYGSNSQNKVSIVLQGSEEKLIIQVNEEKISDENGTCVDSRATVELIAPSPEHTESEVDLIGLAVLERIAEQTEQQSSHENFSLTPEVEGADGEHFSVIPEGEGAEEDKVPHQELSVTKIDDAYVKGIFKEEMKPLNEEEVAGAKLDEVEDSSWKSTSVMNQNNRSIWIHGTPRRPIKTADMKENSAAQLKRERDLGDATALRAPLAKRKALGELNRR